METEMRGLTGRRNIFFPYHTTLKVFFVIDIHNLRTMAAQVKTKNFFY